MDYNRLKNEEKAISKIITEDNFNAIPLDTNRRSLPNVIDFNNRFFDFYANAIDKGDYFSEVKQNKPEDKNEGAVFAILFDKDSPHLDLSCYKNDTNSFFLENYYSELSKTYSYMVYSIYDALNRGYNYSDIMVLMSGNDKCKEFANILMTACIPVVTTESLSIADNEAVSVIIATLNYYLYPKDTVNQAVILKYLSKKNNIDFIDGLLFSDVFEEKLKKIGFDDFQFRIERILKNPILFAIKDLIAFYEFGVENNPFLSDFLDLVADFQQQNIANLKHFLQYWNDLVFDKTIPTLSLPKGHNAVRVMTIHKSKGLESPIVITYCKDASKGQSTNIWVNKDNVFCSVPYEKNMLYSEFRKEYEQEKDDIMLDKLNKWYVDFTRAKDILYLITTKPSKNPNSDSKNVSSFLSFFFFFQFQSKDDVIYIWGNENQRKATSKKEKSKSASFDMAFSRFSFYGDDKIKITESSEDEARSLGNDIHLALQKIRVFPRNEEEIDVLLARQPLFLREKLRNVFQQIIEKNEFYQYFFVDEDDIVKNEAEIVLKDGTTKRPDRIVFKNDHVMIIDYKTGKEFDEIYRKQLNFYRESLFEMGFENVKAEVLYLKV